ncbi:MAG: phospholipase [Anaerolineae bacterium]|nr:phospholipase [Anaerolineae bacterium]
MPTQPIHENKPVLTYGTPLNEAQTVVILVHGRGATAESILSLANYLPQEGVAYLAPQAANNTWYPNSGFGPLESNEPFVSSAFQTLTNLIAHVTEAGITPQQLLIGGFSQGACLASEFVARNADRYGGLFMLSGALMGPLDMSRDYAGSLDGTPVFIGGCDHDSWVAEPQMRMSARVLEQLGGTVTIEIQPGFEHTIRETEIDHVRQMIAEVAK